MFGCSHFSMGVVSRVVSVVCLSLLFSCDGFCQVSLTLQVTNSVCGYGNGVIYVKATGGTAPYDFSDNGGPVQTNPLFSGLTAGTHVIKVVDKNGASATATA